MPTNADQQDSASQNTLDIPAFCILHIARELSHGMDCGSHASPAAYGQMWALEACLGSQKHAPPESVEPAVPTVPAPAAKRMP